MPRHLQIAGMAKEDQTVLALKVVACDPVRLQPDRDLALIQITAGESRSVLKIRKEETAVAEGVALTVGKAELRSLNKQSSRGACKSRAGHIRPCKQPQYGCACPELHTAWVPTRSQWIHQQPVQIGARRYAHAPHAACALSFVPYQLLALRHHRSDHNCTSVFTRNTWVH